MKKLFAITLIAVGTLAGAGAASADNPFVGGYTGWAADAFTSAAEN